MELYYDEKIKDEIYFMSDIIYLVSVVPMADYKLLLEFSTKEKRIFDVNPLLKKPYFQILQIKSIFNSAHINYGTVVWNDKLDLCPESLYRDSKPLGNSIT